MPVKEKSKISVQSLKLDHRGFTFLELLVAVTILAVLSAIAVPMYKEMVLDMEIAKAKINMLEIAKAQKMYRDEMIGTGNDPYTSDYVLLQKYVDFTMDDGHWDYDVLCSGTDFGARATHQSFLAQVEMDRYGNFTITP